MTTTPGSISVVIATYNRAPLLDECLAHLGAQHFAPGDQVVVVDNGSTDQTAAVVARHQRSSAVPLQLLREPQPGKSHAIARALDAASGEILAFTDDDVNVGPAWLDAIREAMADRSVALAGGPVAGRWEATVPHWVRAALDAYPRLGAPIGLLDYGERVTDLGTRTLLGANLAVRRDMFLAVGGFPTHLGKLRGTLLSGEDHELCRRVQAAGGRAIYAPAAVVHHWVPADRAHVRYFLRWFFWSGITHAIMDHDSAPDRVRTVARVPAYIVRRIAIGSAGALGGLLAARWTSSFNHAIDVAFAAGYTAQRWGLARRAAGRNVPAGEPA